MTKKYLDGLPLARQEKIWKRQGVELSRATLANWVIQPTQTWLKPLYRHMKQHLIGEAVIHADETVVQVPKEPDKEATSESRMWVVEGVTHCGCWAHARRKWREAMPDGATTKTSKAAKGYRYCNKLFAE